MNDLSFFPPFHNHWTGWGMHPGHANPPIDLYQTEDEIIVTAEIPGIKDKDQLEISISEENLTVAGQIERTREVKGEKYFQRERSLGNFYRTIPLPRGVNTENAKADYRNGILEVRIPKLQKEQKRRLDLNIQ